MEEQKPLSEDCTQSVPESEALQQAHPHSNEGEHHHSEHHHRTHHHHESHSHGHHHSRSKKRKKNPFLRFLKRNHSVIINVVSCTISVVLLLVLALTIDAFNKESEAPHYTEQTNTTLRLETSVFSKEVPLVNDAIFSYLDPSNQLDAHEIYKAFDGYHADLSEGLAVKILYRVSGLPAGSKVLSAVLELSEDPDYRNPQTFQLSPEEDVLEIDMLKTGTKYYYRVTLNLSNAEAIGTTGSFKTAPSPRILSIDGIVNVRDLGGWQTSDGKTIKQGLIYRGSELDGAVQPEYTLTQQGQQQMTQRLGIRFDMDLRAQEQGLSGGSALGKEIVHKYYGVSMYSAILDNREELRALFSDLADPQNYPLYIHCTYGRDRTGSVCYLLEALLGVSDEDLEREYSLSAFEDSYVNLPEFHTLKESVQMLEGNTTQGKVEGYLLSIGVTEAQIQSIRDILLTP